MSSDANGESPTHTTAPRDMLSSTEPEFDRLRQAATATHDRVREQMTTAYENDQLARFEELDDRRTRLAEYHEFLRLLERFAPY